MTVTNFGRFTSKKESNARKQYLKTIEKDVTNRLKSSIHRARFIDIGSEQSLNSTFLPLVYENHDRSEQFTSFDKAFEHFERRILLLGAPGSGKTTTLLHIAQKLIQDAKRDTNAPIPLLFNLSKYRRHNERRRRSSLPFLGRKTPTSEQKKEQTIEKWLIELTSEYPGVSKEQARSWIEGQCVALLLDGLDEVDDQLLVNLVLKLNTYLDHDLDITVVVCTRILDYQPLEQNKETRLHLNGAVTLQPLNQAQIDTYLENAQAIPLRDALPNDAALYELAQTPLTLSMMTLAYGGLAPTDIPSNLSLIERRRHLFDTYVDRMMERKARRDAGIPFDLNPDHDQPTPYTREQINHYLGWLAVRLSERNQTVFPLHKLHSFLDQDREDEQDEVSWRVTDLANATLIFLCTLLIGLSLMPKSLIGLAQAILISGVVALTLGVLFYYKKNKFEISPEIMGVFIPASLIASIYFFPDKYLIRNFLIYILHISHISLISQDAIMVVLLIAGVYVYNLLISGPSLKYRFLFVMITVISVLFPIGVITLSGQMNLPEVVIAMSMVVFLTILESKNSFRVLRSSFLSVLIAIGAIGLIPIISITPDWYQGTVFIGVALAVVLLNERQANIIIGEMLDAVFSRLLAGSPRAALGTLLQRRTDGISEKYLVNPILRVILAIGGSIPLKYKAFLNYTIHALLLKEVGTEYEFVHRLLRDHFAIRELTPLLNEGNIEQTLQVIQKLSLQGESALDTLAVLATDSDARVRQAVVVGLGKIATYQAVELMKKALHDPDTRVRQAVVANVNRLTEDDVKELLEIALRDEELNVRLAVVAGIGRFKNLDYILYEYDYEYIWSDMRQAAVKALTQIGNSTVVLKLLKPLRNSDQYIRRAAAEALGLIGDVTAVPELLTALRDSDDGVRRAAGKALGLIGDVTAVPGLLTALRDSDDGVRRAAAEALGQIGRATAMSGLLRALCNSDDEVQPAVASALGQIGHATAMSGLLRALWDSDDEVRREARSALIRIRMATVVPKLPTALRNNYALVRWAAAWGLGLIGDASAVSVLLTALGDSHGWVRGAAASALGLIGDASAVSGLLTALGDSDKNVRSAVASALGQIRDVRVVPELLIALRDSHENVRRAAASALRQIGDARAVSGLLTALCDSDNGVRQAAALALGQIGDATAVSGLLIALRDSYKNVRWAAALALAQIGDARAVPGLLIALRDSHDRVRRTAAWVLGRIGDARAVPGLIERLTDSSKRYFWSGERVCDAAAEALERIGTPEALEAVEMWRQS